MKSYIKFIVLVSLAFLCLKNSSRADIGNMAYISLNVSFVNNANRTLYISIPEYGMNPDSIDSSEYVKRVILSWTTYQDSSIFYNIWSEYSYVPRWNDNETEVTLVGLYEPENIPITSISAIKVNCYHYQSAAFGLKMPDSFSNNDWLKTKANKEIHAYSYSCDFTIFQYEESTEINNLISEFIAVSQKTNDFESQNDMFEYLEQLSKYKIVIITMCTC